MQILLYLERLMARKKHESGAEDEPEHKPVTSSFELIASLGLRPKSSPPPPAMAARQE